jgi:hypothetical protein
MTASRKSHRVLGREHREAEIVMTASRKSYRLVRQELDEVGD